MALNTGTRLENASKNTIVAFLNKMVILVLTFVSRKFFIVYIGIEYLGINSLFSNVLTLLSMADLGLGTAMNVSLYRPIANNDTKKISALLGYFRKLYWYIAIATAIIGVSLVPFLKYIVNLENAVPYIEVYYLILVLKNVVSYLFVYKSSIIKADQKMYLVNKIEIYITVVRTIIQIVCIVVFKIYIIYILLEVLGVFAHNLVVSYIADKYYPFIKEKQVLEESEKKNIFSDVYSMFLYKVSWTLLNGTDNILISVIVGTIAVGMYGNYFSVTSTIENMIALLFGSLTASVGNLVATSKEESRYNVFLVMQMVSNWIGGMSLFCVYFCIQDFIGLLFGVDLQLDQLTVVAIVLNMFFSTCMRPVWTFREGTGMYRQIRYVMCITAILNIILSIALGIWLGVSGILFATSISKVCTYFWYEPKILYQNFFHQKTINYYLDSLKNFLLILLAFGAGLIIVPMIPTGTAILWIVKGFVCFVIINIFYFIRYFKTPQFATVKNIGMKLLKR